MLKISDIFDVQCIKFWYKFVNKSLPEYFDTMFTFNNELYQIEARGQNQLHLFPIWTISARSVLRHRIPDLLQGNTRAINQKANTHSIESFGPLLKAYTTGSYSYECGLTSFVFLVDAMIGNYHCLIACTSIWWMEFPLSCLHVTHVIMFVCMTSCSRDRQSSLLSEWLILLPVCSPQGGFYVSGQAWP